MLGIPGPLWELPGATLGTPGPLWELPGTPLADRTAKLDCPGRSDVDLGGHLGPLWTPPAPNWWRQILKSSGFAQEGHQNRQVSLSA